MLITRQYTTQSIVCCLLLHLVILISAAGIVVVRLVTVTPFLSPALHGIMVPQYTTQYTTQSYNSIYDLNLVTLVTVRAAGKIVTPFLSPGLHGPCCALPLSRACCTLPAQKILVLYLAEMAPAIMIPPHPDVLELVHPAAVPSARAGVRHGPP